MWPRLVPTYMRPSA